MGTRSFRDRIERAFALAGLAMAAVLPFFIHLFKRLLRIPTPEDREWAEIEETLYGERMCRTAFREAVR
jgi:hypothetical protein